MTAQPAGASLFGDPGLLRAIAEATDDAVFAKDLAGRYRFANPAALQALGGTAGQVLGRTDLEILGDQAAARSLMESDQQVLRSGQPAESEVALVVDGGTVRHWHTRRVPLRDCNGVLIGLAGIARDITQRKQAEVQREAGRLLLEMGVQAAGLVMAEIDYPADQAHVCGDLARLLELGDGPMRVPCQAIADRIHPADRERYLRAIDTTRNPDGSGHLAIDVRAQMPSGALRWLHIRLLTVFATVDGKRLPQRGIYAARDVTAERMAGRKLRAAQRLTQSVIDGTDAVVYAKDLEGRYILANHAWRTQHGVPADKVPGITDEQVFGPELARALRANDLRVQQAGQPILVHESVLAHGRCVTFRSSKFPLFDDSGRIYAVCGVSTDISDVMEADRRKDEFIATLAHELRNPLAPIRNGLEILRRIGALPPQAARTREMMERQLAHLVRLVDDLLDVSRISRGKLELRMERVTVAEVLAHALETSQPAIDAGGHTLVLELPQEPMALRGDLTRLAQVFSNLVNNAAKYTGRGGRIRVHVGREAGSVLVEVSDNGAGIALDLLPQVFDLFAQGHHPSQGGAGGLGIGLWLVRQLVELHGGSITAHSEGPGRGSTFAVRLPLLQD